MRTYYCWLDKEFDFTLALCDNCERTFNFMGYALMEDFTDHKCGNCGVDEFDLVTTFYEDGVS